MTKATKQPRAFDARTAKFLRSVSDLPWAEDACGMIRVLDPDGNPVCPMCMAVNRKLNRWAYSVAAVQANAAIGRPLPALVVGEIMAAADDARSPWRGELIRLLGGLRIRNAKGQPVVRS